MKLHIKLLFVTVCALWLLVGQPARAAASPEQMCNRPPVSISCETGYNMTWEEWEWVLCCVEDGLHLSWMYYAGCSGTYWPGFVYQCDWDVIPD